MVTAENMHKISSNSQGYEYDPAFKQAQIVNGKKVKNLRLEDTLETFDVRFRVHIPEYHPNAEMRVVMKDTIIKDKEKNVREGEGYRMFNPQ